MSAQFKAGDKVEWTNTKGVKQTGIIIETGDNMKYLIKHDGKYIAIQEKELRRVNENG